MRVPRPVRYLNRAATNRAMGLFAGRVPPFAVVEHVGRVSGAHYRTPIVAVRTEDGWVVPLPYGTDTDWCANVLAAGDCTVVVGGRHLQATKPELADEEAVADFPAALQPVLRAAHLPGYLRLTRIGG